MRIISEHNISRHSHLNILLLQKNKCSFCSLRAFIAKLHCQNCAGNEVIPACCCTILLSPSTRREWIEILRCLWKPYLLRYPAASSSFKIEEIVSEHSRQIDDSPSMVISQSGGSERTRACRPFAFRESLLSRINSLDITVKPPFSSTLQYAISCHQLLFLKNQKKFSKYY